MYNNLIKLGILLVCLLFGLCFAKLYQPADKTINIYKNALTDYNNENYQNAYFLFSKVGYLSALKPFALYNQALSAKALGDKSSELDRYKVLLRLYPSNKLADEVYYQAAQLLVEDNPQLAYKYFKKVLNSNLGQDYKVAAEYYIARISATKIRYSKKISSREKIADVEKYFRAYLEHASDGRLAVNVSNYWRKFNPNLKSEDAVLIARAYNNAGLYSDSKTVLKKASVPDAWALSAINLYTDFSYARANSIVEEGVSIYADSVERQDYKRAVDLYIKNSFEGEVSAINRLNILAKGAHSDYILNKRCKVVLPKDKYTCYASLYQGYPAGEYAGDSLYQMIMLSLKVKDYKNVRNLSKDFLSKFPGSSYAPQVAFWLAKMEQQVFHSVDFIKYYQDVVNNYPDSYYAYRAFWLLNGIKSATINTALEYKPVVYPYKAPNKKDVLYVLLSVNDYEMVKRYSKDEFLSSWIEYEKGNYTKSMIIARDAMDKLEKKPPKGDLRWRLVYPQNYYKQVKKYADEYKNVDALIMAIVREESSFNPKAQSSVGAMGLMQLMPSTAHEVGMRAGIDFNTSYLFNPELNIRLGNIYYATLRLMLDDKDVSSIAAYNGGIGAVSRWKSTLQYNDTDEFVEQIPYEETKNYVKKVFRSYWNYTRIYQYQ